eukprot:CAMPEP_0206210992 /NCGR_PEP_ID=MMETSP0166-20121206/17869_1 /ASSEMBLY_ACC=CAM_ASM_000260 /TAXON_ID=95228 /ORGANISM="Vannella robusta, Strain DIVA3 518/3/11/1/6" /LENGTH=82 /DNA_ID=CAMNT_0053632755 /DNA_START=395 /DNA_END=643 /DNA_ORIENTATION=-
MPSREISITAIETEDASIDELKVTIQRLFDIPCSTPFYIYYNGEQLEEGTLISNSISGENCPSTIQIQIIQPSPAKSAAKRA